MQQSGGSIAEQQQQLHSMCDRERTWSSTAGERRSTGYGGCCGWRHSWTCWCSTWHWTSTGYGITMPGKKRRKQKESSFLDISILKKFLHTYEQHCEETQSSLSPTIKKSLSNCISNEVAITKFVLSSHETIPEGHPPVLFKPLVTTIRNLRYMLGKELCIWGILLSNLDIVSLALMLELNGRTIYPFHNLEMIDCGIDVWSMERLGKALSFSNLVSIVLDYNKELYLNGNYLQCSGAVELINTISTYALGLSAERHTASETNTDFAHHILEATGSAGIHTAVSDLDVVPETHQPAIPEGTENIKKRIGKKKKKREAPVAGPWLAKLHLADNGIDGRGNEGEAGVLEFTQLLSYLIRYSNHLAELDLDHNCIGELPANDILEALVERKKGKLSDLEIKVTAQISLDAFTSILKNSKKLKSIKKKKKRL
uniref:RING-box protein 2 isoform X2 n=1 Tax=Geotrypetes seraphini TaxID=260995 RepID=A0A6P8S998_GEOSA|nr:RING-box protein 2 isoform X2 [Geotrypetes seraphini]